MQAVSASGDGGRTTSQCLNRFTPVVHVTFVLGSPRLGATPQMPFCSSLKLWFSKKALAFTPGHWEEQAVSAGSRGFAEPVLDTSSQAHPGRIYCFGSLINAKLVCDGWAGLGCSLLQLLQLSQGAAVKHHHYLVGDGTHRAGPGKGAAPHQPAQHIPGPELSDMLRSAGHSCTSSDR